jgi:hypothetical protein
VYGLIVYNGKTQELSFINKAVIPATGILLGGSTRQNDLDLIGQFGEGFKIPPEETERQVSVIIGNVTVEEWKDVYENKLLRLSP